MALLDMQRAFSRLIADPTFRDRSAEHGFETLKGEYELTDAEFTALRAIDVARLQRYASMVACKRMDLALGALPRVRQMLGPDFLSRYSEEYARLYPPVPTGRESPMFTEFRRTVAFLQNVAARGEITLPNFDDTLRFETTLFLLGGDIEVSTSIKGFEATHDFDRKITESSVLRRAPGVAVDTFNTALFSDHDSMHRQDVHILMQKRSGESKVRVVKVMPATRRLIESFDGQAPLSDVLTRICADFQKSDIQKSLARCIDTCQSLVAERVLGVVRTYC